MKHAVFHPEALEEMGAAGDFYLEKSAPLADRFYREIDALVHAVRERPGLQRVFDPPARRHFGARFPYALIYVEKPDVIWIVAVMHFKQRPGYWRHRLE